MAEQNIAHERSWRDRAIVVALTLVAPVVWITGALVVAMLLPPGSAGRHWTIYGLAELGVLAIGGYAGERAGRVIYHRRHLRRHVRAGVLASVVVSLSIIPLLRDEPVSLLILVPMMLALTLGAWMAGCSTARLKRRRRLAAARNQRAREWLCANCGYSLRGLPTDVCPECGQRGGAAHATVKARRRLI
jgi:predicted MFS family arabinose efflux permease